MDVFINTFQKLGEFLLRPWRQGQPLHTGPPLVMVSMVTPLLALVKTLLIELLNSGKYQFKDTRLMKSLMVLHTVMCTAPMTGQLSSLAHKVCVETFFWGGEAGWGGAGGLGKRCWKDQLCVWKQCCYQQTC